MFFFGPFSLFPDPVGQFLYMALSIALFAWGAHALLKAVVPKERLSPVREIFLALCAAPMLGAVVSTKVEIVMTGILMLAAASLARGRALAWAGIALAVVANWKLQPAPTILLLILVLWRERGLGRFGAGLGGGLLVAWALPRLFLPWSYLSLEETAWANSLAAFTRSSVFNFENVFTFLKFSTGFETPWWLIQVTSAVVGFLLASTVWRKPSVLLAVALGAAFTMAFSPLGQNSALILTAPLLLWITLRALEGLEGRREQILYLGAVWLALAVTYSDLIPGPIRDLMHALSVKQMLLLAATCFALSLELRVRPKARSHPG